MAFFGSLCLYIRGEGIAYIDALFLASGCATQSGLNTVNINSLNTWQQLVLYFIPMVTNPIVVNSFVVFLRLYWFEKRFQNIAQEAKKNRRTVTSFAKSRTTPKDERDIGQEERGVNGRSIVVMHGTTKANGVTKDRAAVEDLNRHLEKEKSMNQDEDSRASGSTLDDKKKESSKSGGEGDQTLYNAMEAVAQPQIKFADQMGRDRGREDDSIRLPVERNKEDHIRFVERQRNPSDRAVLRIPGPRDADAGMTPEAVDETDGIQQTISRRGSVDPSQLRGQLESLNPDDHPLAITDSARTKRNITIAEPDPPPHPRVERASVDAHAAANTLSDTLSALRLRKPRIFGGNGKLHEEGNNSPSTNESAPALKAGSRSQTFQTIRNALSQSKDEDPTPYLSWAPTIGRNSAFVDLTLAQREELGGIEYRSLKSLALILVIYFWGFSIFGVVCLTPWIYKNHTYGSIVENDGQGRAWWGLFTANSAFTDLGFTLTPDSMISFNTAIWPLLLMSYLVIIGNTGFPIMLRIIIWICSKYVPKGSGIWEELRFLLDHPRRCFTLLFPGKATWWLFWILVILNGLDLIFYIVLDVSTRETCSYLRVDSAPNVEHSELQCLSSTELFFFLSII